MEQVAHALGQLLLRAVPTFVLVLLLYLFLKKIFFVPLDRLLARRYQESEGALKAAREAAAEAERRALEYQNALKEARAEIYRLQENERQKTVEECNQQLQQARAQAEQRLQAAREQIQAEAGQARLRLAAQSEELAEAIAKTVLNHEAETAT